MQSCFKPSEWTSGPARTNTMSILKLENKVWSINCPLTYGSVFAIAKRNCSCVDLLRITFREASAAWNSMPCKVSGKADQFFSWRCDQQPLRRLNAAQGFCLKLQVCETLSWLSILHNLLQSRMPAILDLVVSPRNRIRKWPWSNLLSITSVRLLERKIWRWAIVHDQAVHCTKGQSMPIYFTATCMCCVYSCKHFIRLEMHKFWWPTPSYQHSYGWLPSRVISDSSSPPARAVIIPSMRSWWRCIERAILYVSEALVICQCLCNQGPLVTLILLHLQHQED